MKVKKQDGKGRSVPTHQLKNEPKETLKKLIRNAFIRKFKTIKEREK